MKKIIDDNDTVELDVRRPLLAKILSFGVVLGALFSVSLFLVMATLELGAQDLSQSTARGLLAIMDVPIIIACIVLAYLHRDIYVFNTKKKLDERQKVLRAHAYENSFRISATMLFLVLFVVQFATFAGEDISLTVSGARGNNHMLGLFFVLLSLPAIVASLMPRKKQ